MSNLLVILLSAGGAAFLTAVVAGLRSLSTTRLENEAALIKRLSDSAISATKEAEAQRTRAIKQEQYSEITRQQRDDALDTAALYRRYLIQNGIDPSTGNPYKS